MKYQIVLSAIMLLGAVNTVKADTITTGNGKTVVAIERITPYSTRTLHNYNGESIVKLPYVMSDYTLARAGSLAASVDRVREICESEEFAWINVRKIVGKPLKLSKVEVLGTECRSDDVGSRCETKSIVYCESK